MTMQEVYDLLVEAKRVHITGMTVKDAESLRIMLVKKWSIHKARLDKLGWLDEDTERLAVCLREAKTVEPENPDATGVIFLLQERKKSTVQYTVLIPQMFLGVADRATENVPEDLASDQGVQSRNTDLSEDSQECRGATDSSS